MNRTTRVALVPLLVSLASGALAQTPGTPAQSDARELEDLVAILSEETAVATKTRMNSDFVPGVVTVLHGDELEALGVETAWEALSFVPGILPVRDRVGLPSVLVRGLPFPFNSGNVRVLVNGVALARELAGINGTSLYIPIQLVDRIEVIRGPGSVVYGDFAFMGLVNIVTRTEGARVYLRSGGDRAVSGGAAWATPDNGAGMSIAVSGSGWASNDAAAAAPRELDERRAWGRLDLGYKGFSLSADGVSRSARQTNAGIAGEPASGSQDHGALGLRYERDLRESLHADVSARYLQNRFETAAAGFSGKLLELGSGVRWEGWKGHSLLLSAGYTTGEVDSARQNRPPPPGTMGPPASLVVRDRQRRTLGLTIQDGIDLSSRLAVTAGVRFDRHSDVGNRFTPRLAVVFRASDRHILKLQYAEGFRAPTFFELYSRGTLDPDVSFEVNGTTELNYVYRGTATVARLTLFSARIRDMIYVRPGGATFDNSRKARANGAEVELEQQIGTRLKARVGVSYVDAEDTRNAAAVLTTPAATTKWLGNLALLFRAGPRALLGLHYRYVGPPEISAANAKAYHLVDLTATHSRLFLPGLQVRAGVKNLFDEGPRYVLQQPNAVEVYAYPGRTFFLQLGWSP